jgi:hypothetical protein
MLYSILQEQLVMTATLAPSGTFESFPYERPDLAAVTIEFDRHLRAFEQAQTLEEQSDAIQHLNAVREEFGTMYNLCYIRHTVNTADPFYEQENTYFDENLPAYEELVNRFYRALLRLAVSAGAGKKIRRQLFVLAELALKTFQPAILEDLQQENALEYGIHQTESQSADRVRWTYLQPQQPDPARTLRRPRRTPPAAQKPNGTFMNGNADTVESDLRRYGARPA